MATNSKHKILLSSLLQPHAILLHMQASHREAALRELAQLAVNLLGNPAALEPLVRALLERESLHSTGIGDGVALPHARQVLSDLASQPLLIFGRHPAGLPFNAIDNQPVHLFFLILATNLSQHLYLLARLSRILRQKTVRQALLKADKPAQVIRALEDAEATLP